MIAASRRVWVIEHPPSVMKHSTKTPQNRRLYVGSYRAKGRPAERILEGRVQSTRSRRRPLNGPYFHLSGGRVYLGMGQRDAPRLFHRSNGESRRLYIIDRVFVRSDGPLLARIAGRRSQTHME